MSHTKTADEADSTLLTDEEKNENGEEDTHNAQTTPADEENDAPGKEEDGGDKDNDSDNENNDRQTSEETKDKDEDENKDTKTDQIEDGEEDRLKEENVDNDDEDKELEDENEEKDEKEEKDEETAELNEDSREDQDETEENKKEEDDGLTEKPDDESNLQEDKADLSDEEIARLRTIFDRKAVNGRVDLKGFKILFRLLGEVASSNEAEEMFEGGDTDNDKTIDFEEFCRLYSKFRQEEQDRKQTILASIDKLFPGSDGETVELKKVEQLLMKLQNPDLDTRLSREKSDLGEDDIRQLVREMDEDGSWRISRQEFVNALCQHIEL